MSTGGQVQRRVRGRQRGRLHPLPPAGILDTRNGTGGIMGQVGGGTTANVQFTGRGGVPASGVNAMILNATVTEPAGAGFLTSSLPARPDR